MDQEAFRQLVSTSSAVAGPSSNRVFGKAHRRAHPNPSSSSASTKPSDLQPRKSKPNTHDSYVDRAAARRSGNTDAEFRDIEALYADFEDRIAAATTEEERQKLRDQISSVGGDARYSVLVKGLDWALLAQNRAKIAREAGGDTGEGAGEGEGDDLEAAYQESKGKGSARDEANDTGTKRSREEIVEAIKRRRQGKDAAAADEIAKGGFRPIGFKPIGAADKQDDSTEYKWVNGKRMRKKKKRHSESTDAVSPSLEDHATVAKQPGGASTRPQSRIIPSPPAERKAPTELPSQQLPQTSADDTRDVLSSAPNETGLQEETPSLPPTATNGDAETSTAPPAAPMTGAAPPAPAPASKEEEADSEDEDIFADVGGWDGIPDAQDDVPDTDAAPHDPVPAEPARSSPPPVSVLQQAEAAPVKAADDLPVGASAPATPAQDSVAFDSPIAPAAPEIEEAAEPPVPLPEVEPSSQSARPKKSKWDDADDARDKKKKKHKKKH